MKNKFYFLFLIFSLGTSSQVAAQTTTTVGGLTTATSGNFTATSSMLVNISGTDYQFVPNTLARVVLSNLTVTNSGSVFTLTGIVSTTPSLSGVLTLTQNTTGVLTLSSLSISSTGSASIGSIPLSAVTISTTGVYSGTIAGIGFGRATTGVHFISPVTNTAYTTGTNSPYGLSFEPGGLGMYARVPSSRSFDWYIDATNVAGINSSGFYASALTTNLRGSGLQLSTSNAAASGTITATNVIETLTGGITRTLSITGQTGRIYWCHNIGATTCTLNGGGANINGASTQGILTGSKALLFSDGTNAYGIIQ